MPKITKIPSQKTTEKRTLRVAAYARVSDEDLEHSLISQITYFRNYINSNPEWCLAGVFADDSISGTDIVHRPQFNRLVAECEAGNIDMVVCKSISRFARNTVDLLKTTRRLKELGIPVYFEREGINSMTGEGELMLTLLASFAQEESRSISENVKWAVRKGFEQGKQNGVCPPYGYRWDGTMYRVVPEEAEVVKEIFSLYLGGESATKIAKKLADKGVTGKSGKPMNGSAVLIILENPAYIGVKMLQKYYIENGKRKTNRGELPQYLVEEMFEPVISKTDFAKAQEIRKERAEAFHKPGEKKLLTGLMKCGYCGKNICQRASYDGKVVKWGCDCQIHGGKDKCELISIHEDEIMEQISAALNGKMEKLKERINLAILYNDKTEFLMNDGNIKIFYRKYGGYKRRTGFSGKVFCGACGGKCLRSTVGKYRRKVWECTACKKTRLPEEILRESADIVLGEHSEAKTADCVKTITVYDDRMVFNYKDGKSVAWKYQNDKKTRRGEQ